MELVNPTSDESLSNKGSGSMTRKSTKQGAAKSSKMTDNVASI